MGLRLQQIAIPAINLVRDPKTTNAFDCLTLSEARDLYLRLKGAGNDRIFILSTQRNAGCVIQVLGDHALSAYSTVDASKFRDGPIPHKVASDTIKRVSDNVG